MATNKTGGEVDAYCTRCKMDLAHTILAMVGTKIARVRCNTCGGDHAYRGTQPSSSSAPKAKSTRATPASRAAAREEKIILSFEAQLADKDTANAVRYSPRETFRVDQVVEHPTFGLGFVKEVRGDKVDIVFKTETRTLVHGRSGAPAERPSFQRPTARMSGPADKPQAASADEAEPSAPSADEQA